MDIFQRIDINLIALILLAIVLIVGAKRLDIKTTLNKAFFVTGIVVMMQLAFETITCIINKQPGTFMIVMSNVFHVFLFITAPVLSYVWYVLIKNLVIPFSKTQAKWNLILMIPVIVNTLFSLLSPFFGYFFTIDSLNVYQRGDWFLLSAAITYLYLFIGTFFIVHNHKKIVRTEFLLFIIISLLPIFGGLLQTLFYGILLMWSSAAFALVLGYIFLQQRMIHLDGLTGCWTRDSIQNHLDLRLAQRKGEPFVAIFLDIDKLKDINDRYGHYEGDSAISTITGLIKEELNTVDIIARMGGDEFLIIQETDSLEVGIATVQKIKKRLKDYNLLQIKDYSLQCSFGVGLYTDKCESIEGFLRNVDALMYDEKRDIRKTN